MMMVGAMAAVLWGIGALMGTPRRARWVMIGVLMCGVMFVQFALPDGHPLREATGGDPRLWLLILAFAGLIWIYRVGLARMRQRADQRSTPNTPTDPSKFSPTELDRYARHIVLREVGGPGQKALKQAKVLVIGAGGLGSPALQYLAAAGVGTIGVIDDDVVDNANLQRQVIHTDDRIGEAKVFSAQIAMKDQNPFVEVRAFNRRLTADIARDLFADYDLILDGSDNFATRYLVNETCVALDTPLIAAALTQWEGQISLYHPAKGGPCYACVFPQAPDPALVPSCAEAGVIGPLPGVVGAMMALEAIKHICDAGDPLMGRILIYDALYAENRVITARKRPDCAICAQP